MSVLLLNENDVRQLLDMPLALEGVEAGFRKLALDEAENIPRARARTDHVMLHVLSAAAKTLGFAGLKSYTSSRRGTHFHVTLYDGKTGELLAIIQADFLGRMRTGAASGVASKLLARPDSAVLGIIGCGGQALTQVQAICAVRPIREVRAYCRTPEKRAAFVTEVGKYVTATVQASESAEQAVRGADIVVTATTSREPVLRADWLAPGMHINAIGSNYISNAELEPAVFAKTSLVVVDNKEQARLEAGDFRTPIETGQLTWIDIRELAPLLIGRYPSRQSAEEITLFKSLGVGIEDIAVAGRVYQKAKAAGLGQVVQF